MIDKRIISYMWQSMLVAACMFALELVIAHYKPELVDKPSLMVPLFFFAVGLAMIKIYCKKPSEGRMSAVRLLAIRGIRLSTSLLIMIIVTIVYGGAAKCFLVVFGINYIVFLVFDCLFFMKLQHLR